MCTLELGDQYFTEIINEALAIPETVDYVKVSTGMSGWVEVCGYKLVPGGQRIFPNHVGPNQRFFKRDGENVVALTVYEREIGFEAQAEPVLQVRLFSTYLLYVCPFEGDIKVETVTNTPCRYFIHPTLDRGGSIDRFLRDLEDEGDPSISAALYSIADTWPYEQPPGEDHATTQVTENQVHCHQ